MLVVENVKSALLELWSNRFRSFLTVVGIIIAVMAVIGVVSILEGMSAHVTNFILGLGADVIWIAPKQGGMFRGSAEPRYLVMADAEAIESQCDSVRYACPIHQLPITVRYRGTETQTPLAGTTLSFQEVRNWYVDVGRFFSPVDLAHAKSVCVLGRDVAGELEKDPAALVGKDIYIEGNAFRVIGLLEKKGSFLGQKQDQIVVVPISAARKLMGPSVYRSVTIMAQAVGSQETEEASHEIRALLRRRHRLRLGSSDDFELITQEQTLAFFRKTSRVVTVVLAGIVGISLLVGGIGIMNIMLVSVTERTREVGILKAIGASRRDVLIQFLTEAVVLSLIGGLIGIALGAGLGVLVGLLSPLPQAQVPLWAVALGFLFSAGVGISFGLYPAMKAARLNPIEALRYE